MKRIKYVDYNTGDEILLVIDEHIPSKGDKVIIHDIIYYVDGNKEFNYDCGFI